MLNRYLSAIICLIFTSSCVISPVPKNMEHLYKETQRVVPVLEQVLQEGDINFRLSDARVLNNKISFSKLIADLCESDFSHAALIYKITDEGVIVADVSVLGIERKFLRDWYIDETKNVVVKRLKPQYQQYKPKVLAELYRLIQEDVLYDEHFIQGNDKYYCTEVVDHCFRLAGLPLADAIRIKDLPAFNLIHSFASLIAQVNVNDKVIVAGNESIGLFSSPFLETVIDLR